MSLISEYKTIILDCDGVILDSNGVKDKAYRLVAGHYQDLDIIVEFGEYRLENSNLSRYEQLMYLYELGRTAKSSVEFDSLLKMFHQECTIGLLKCEVTNKLLEFLFSVKEGVDVFVVSAGDEDELIDVFRQRGLDKYFKEICGSPHTKTEILQDLRHRNKLRTPCLMIGDSNSDFIAAHQFDMDFIFIYGYTDNMISPEFYKSEHGKFIIKDLSVLT